MQNILSLVKWLIILLVVLGLAFFVYLAVKINQPFKTTAAEQEFVVTPGLSTKQIARDLAGQGLINRALFFEVYVTLKGQGHKLQAGPYVLSATMPIREIVAKLTAGQVADKTVKFTVREGMRASEIAEALEEQGIVGSREFMAVVLPSPIEPGVFSEAEFAFLVGRPRATGLEGYLFPDTYFYQPETAAREVARKMLENFDRKLTSETRQAISDQEKTVHEIVTLASIIEKEVGRNVLVGTKLSQEDLEKLRAERRLVASVFYNRLAIGMPLESDATISYITGRPDSARATLEETRIDSSYNTYRNRGLPPGPISNPSLDAIEAAIYPAESDYFFFLTSPDGTAHFARNLQEHVQNRERYLE